MGEFKNNNEIIYAGFKKRFLAYILDGIFLSIIWVIEVTAIGFINPDINSNIILKTLLLSIPTWLVYYPIMESVIQSTLGKRIIKIKVVGADNKSLSFSKSLIRNIGKLTTIFSIIVIGLFLISVSFSTFVLIAFVFLLYMIYEDRQLEKQTWYDKIVDAKVVDEAIVVGEEIDELQYFVNGVRRPFEEFEKAWPRKDNREKKE